MPDVWTKHPDIVRDLLKDAGFKCGVEGRFLKGRDAAWTCIYDGKTMKGDLSATSPLTPEAIGTSAAVLLFGLIAGLTVQRRRRRRPLRP